MWNRYKNVRKCERARHSFPPHGRKSAMVSKVKYGRGEVRPEEGFL
ncbi:hypothetical protein SELSPUOL_02609 [Selenomonas sputigena ATCC 35185]|uniref:Uncharacterized protein n=1 Tax=Selenomonas sputigena (strain ATCC 35185 / DSM 20758 / CCUG 44933 / VPI D19B-28) TaxID=546271 RepID=C9LYP8_SELS3|nr:hypothetical protein SELSPUOL_02609 [Selenomonas sputigena ATCC 35185]